MEENNMKNPWLGLDSYQEGEILYGRNDDMRILTQYVLANRDTLFYGKSGIGKSSVLNACVIPAARRNDFIPVVIRLLHKEAPSYLDQIKSALEGASIQRKEVVECKEKDRESVYEFFHRHEFYDKEGNRAKILILFDQFEEIFTLQTDAQKKKRFFYEMADFLNDIQPKELQSPLKQVEPVERKLVDLSDEESLDDWDDEDDETESTAPTYVDDNEIHMVFTIREDFLSEFEYYASSIPSLRQNRYGLRPLSEEQASQIIMYPVPGLVDKDVAKLIIEKVTGRDDFTLDDIPEIEVDSAVLSLYMNRLFEAKTTDTITRELVESKGHEIISDFYRDAIQSVSEHTVEYLEDMLLNGFGCRDNITEDDAKNNVPQEELDFLCNTKKILRRFNLSGAMRIEYVHDILCPVVKAHKEERALAKQQEEERARLLAKQQEELKQIERRAKRNMRRMTSILVTCGVIILIGVVGFVAYYFSYKYEYVTYYRSFERRYGWPVGVDELSASELLHTPLYYRLSHKGYRKTDTDVRVCSSNRLLPRSPRMECLEVCAEDSDKEARAYLELLSRMESIHFEGGERGRLNREVVKGKNDSVLFCVNYSHIAPGRAWAQFTWPTGQPMKIRSNGLDRVKVSWETDKRSRNVGRVTSVVFFDESGACQPADNNVVGYRMAYSEDRKTTTLYALDEYGRPFGRGYNVTTTTRRGDTLEVCYGRVGELNHEVKPATGVNGFWREVQVGNVTYLYLPRWEEPYAVCRRKVDAAGNVTQVAYEGMVPESKPAITLYKYDALGYMTEEKMLHADGTPFGDKEGVYHRTWAYNHEGRLVKEERFNVAREKIYSYRLTRKRNVVREETFDVRSPRYRYLLKVDSLRGRHTSTTYWGENNRPINYEEDDDARGYGYHRVTVDRRDSVETICYYVYRESLHREEPQDVKKSPSGVMVSYFKKVNTYDRYRNLISRRVFDRENRIAESMMYFYRDGRRVARSVMGVDGTPVRCPEWEEEGFGYYMLNFVTDFNGRYVSVNAVNEWNGGSVLYDAYEPVESERYKRTLYFDLKGSTAVNRENGNRYLITVSCKQFIFVTDSMVRQETIPYLHILSKRSPLYGNGRGLKDGDRIVRFGAWSWGDPVRLLAEEWKRSASVEQPVEVLRPTGEDYERKTFRVKTDKSNLNLAEYHVFALCEAELQRLNNNR